MKKLYFLSVIALVMMMAVLPLNTNAQIPTWDGTWVTWTQGSGTQADPYLIESPQQLAGLAWQVNNGISTYNGVYFRLTTDLDMNSLGWTPIGNSTTNRFKGNFDGNGHFIDNIYILVTATNTPPYCGLFGVIDGANIHDLGVNTTITVANQSSTQMGGGLVGYIHGGINNISNCYNNGAITHKYGYYFGGLIGYINGNTNITGCNNSANVGSNANSPRYGGGIVGYINATTTITDCHNTGNVWVLCGSSAGYGGGIAGFVANETSITDCSNSGSIRAYYNNGTTECKLGGVIGFCNTTGSITINNSYNDGNISGCSESDINSSGSFTAIVTHSTIGGLIGRSSSSLIVNNCYNKGTLSTAEHIGGLIGYVENSVSATNCHNKGNINVANESTRNIYGGGLVGYNAATANIAYSFNTGNVSISTRSPSSYYWNWATNAFSGGIVGCSNAFIVIEQCYNVGSLSTFSSTSKEGSMVSGGIAAFVNSSANIRECYNSGTVSGTSCGGIIGNISQSITVANCYNIGLLSGDDRMGTVNFSGSSSPSITNCYYLGTCGGGSSTGSTPMTAVQMQSVSFPGMLNSGVQGTPVFIMDMSPNINQGYPIFGNMIYLITQSATSVGATKATLNGIYSGPADVVGFQYRTNSSNSEWNTVYTSSGSPVSFQLNGLQNSTSYVFRLIVQMSGGNYYGEEITFTTGTCNLTASVTPSSVNICDGETATLTASGQSVFSNQFMYSWDTGETSPSVSVNSGGEHIVTISDTNGCTATASCSVTVRSLPIVTISGNTSLCAGGNSQLTASGGSSYIWNTAATTPTITVTQGGQYSVTATNSYGCSATQSATVTVFSAPVITGNTAFCPDSYTTLTASGGDTYLWSTGATTASINVNTAGNYSVTASTSNGCSGSASVTVVQNEASDVIISGNTVICSGIGTSLTASSGTDYLWSTGETTQSINVNNPGVYSVTVTNNNGCSNSATQTVSLMEQPTILGNNHICSGQSTTLSASGSGSYAWSNGASTLFITVNTPGNYTVTVTLPNGCSSSASVNVSVGTTPTPTILGNTTLCQGETTTLTANGGTSYVWSNASTGNNISVSQSGVYTVTATNAEGCSNTANVTVTVNPLPNVNISGNSSFCQGDNVTLTATGANTYVWSNASTNASITVSNAGNYTVTGTDDNGCSNIATKTVSVNPTYNIPLTHSICQGESYNFYGQNLTTAGTYTHTLQTVNGCDSVLTLTLAVKNLPTPSITGNTTLCEGETTTLIANGGTSYLWSNASTSNSISVSQSGIYTVTATNAEGCSATANVTVTVNSLPTVTISGNSTICQGSSTTLTATGANTYSWSTGENTASVSINAFGIYTVTGTSAEGCSNTANVTVLVSQLPVITITGETNICAGESTTLTANGGETYLWSNGTTDNALTVNAAGIYQVIGYNAAGCSSMADATVNVWQPATVEFTIECPEPCYEWNGESYCQSGDYTQTLQTVHGCDSVVTLHLTITVGIENHDFAAFMTVYPNPTNGIVNVECEMGNGKLGNVTIQFYDIYGKLLGVVETQNFASLQAAQIDLSRYANGVYFIKAVADGNIMGIRKVVKQ